MFETDREANASAAVTVREHRAESRESDASPVISHFSLSPLPSSPLPVNELVSIQS